MQPTSPQPFNRASEDVGNIVEFGHVNLRVPEQQQAIVFYVMGLGLTRDPYQRMGVDNAWINVGTCQFHLPVGPAQLLRCVTGLVMPDLDTGRVLTTLGHEVRSMRHPLYARPLVNRNPANHGDAYMPGHEDAMWRMPPTP